MAPLPELFICKKLVKSEIQSEKRFDENNFAFLQDVIYFENCPEFSGYNTRLNREQGQSLRPKTKIAYVPLIDLTPADPSTMLNALLRAEEISLNAGHEFVIFTCDQQLYRFALLVKWDTAVK